ncbi:MAG: asparagine synthase (glutamine-hydrolyzing) [Gemmataceae bacterium]
MCGILGLVSTRPDAELTPRAVRLGAMIAHRGPDDHAWLAFGPAGIRVGKEGVTAGEDQVVLVHRRLSILDLSDAGRQPLSDPTGRWHLVFNGEIYNYVELRSELEKLGVAFRSRTDTEVLLHSLIHWGRSALPRLVGMFAFALLDTHERRLLLARDFFGIKPLLYARTDRGFAFASELPPLLEVPGVSRQVEPQRLFDYLRFGTTDHGSATLFRDIRQLPPAHCMELREDHGWTGEPVAYWKLDRSQPLEMPFAEATRQTREQFLDNVRLHLRSDVPVGAALSGGIDSSSIVACMRQVEPSLQLHAFSYIAEQAELSEERWIDLAAERSGAILHKVRPAADELIADLDRLIRVQGEPFGSTSIYAQHRVFRAAREHKIPVMLDGQGADEMLGGYRFYNVTRLASLLRRGKLIDATRFLRNAGGLSGTGGTMRFAAQAMARILPGPLRSLGMSLVGRELMPNWLRAEWFRERKVREANVGSATPRSVAEHLEQSMFETNLPMLLRYEDRNSMAYSIESRVPFLTPGLVSFLLRLPEHYLISHEGVSKHVFREAMRGLVPDEILDRRDKIGFVTPEQQWMRQLQPWVEATLRSEKAKTIPAIDAVALQKEWTDVLAGKRYFDSRASGAGQLHPLGGSF